MSSPTVHIVDSFVDPKASGKTGNPAGVVLDADELSAEKRQEIAADAGYSETAFVNTQGDRFRYEFFTPTVQIAQCGHATVAATHLLRTKGLIKPDVDAITIDTVDGPREVSFSEKMIFLGQVAPTYRTVPEPRELAQAMGAAPLPERVFAVSSVGVPFALVEFEDLEALKALRPRFSELEALTKAFQVVGVYAFNRKQGTRETTCSARMFAPALGIEEESATGMAAGAMSAYLGSQQPPLKGIKVRQGDWMTEPSPSLLHVEILRDPTDKILGTKVGGHAAVRQ